jgi:hypothetical protein
MSYPDIEDENFQYEIAKRLEFRNLQNDDGLYPHQEFVRRFMSPYTPYKSLIMYHSLGSGKSIACIATAVDHYLYDGKRCIIVTKGDSGAINFSNEIAMYKNMSKNADKWNNSIFTMYHYISLSNKIDRMSDDEIIKEFSNTIMVLDEVHNIRYLRKVVDKSVYGSIIRLLKLCNNVKMIIATATPMTDNYEQIYSLLGICNHSRENPWSMKGIISYNSTVLDKPKCIRVGTYDIIEDVCIYSSVMYGHQERIYGEKSNEKLPSDIYRELTHISLFCFEDGTYGNIQERNRKGVIQTKMMTRHITKVIVSMHTKKTKKIKYTKYEILPEFKYALQDDHLRNSSSKYSALVESIENTYGNVFVFLEEVRGSGILLLASVLEQHGYSLYVGEDISTINTGKRYTLCVGNDSENVCPNIQDRLEGFNCNENRDGNYVRVLLGSRVIGESITLKNVRHFHCMTPHWNDSIVNQAMGRVIRSGSHNALEKEHKNVRVYIHASIYAKDENNSVDIKKLVRSKEKEQDIKEVYDYMIDKAVDKYCTTAYSNVPITYVDTFSVLYLNIEQIAFRIASIVRDKPYNVYDLSDVLEIHPTICKEVLCRMIMSNMNVGNKFIRAYGNSVFTVDDPSLPYVTAYGKPQKIEYKHRVSVDIPSITDISQFRYMPVTKKIAILEKCIETGNKDFMHKIRGTFAETKDAIYHFLYYRDLDSSYTSLVPTPKRPLGKTRMFDGVSWQNVDASSEPTIFSKYRAIVNELIEQADTELPIYGIISTIDGDMRLRLRNAENQDISSKDKRYVKRGRNMKSIKKSQLVDILNFVGEEYHNNMSMNDLIGKIDDTLVKDELYMFL